MAQNVLETFGFNKITVTQSTVIQYSRNYCY